MGHYETELASLSDEQRASFLGDSLAECFDRMGPSVFAQLRPLG